MAIVVYQSVKKGRIPVDVALGAHVVSVFCFSKGWNSEKVKRGVVDVKPSQSLTWNLKTAP